MLDRIRFGKNDLTRIRGQLVLHTSTIGLFLLGLDTKSLSRIEQRLDEMVVEMRKGNREPTTIIIFGDKNGTRDVDWRRLGAELQRRGMESEDIVTHKHGIRAYVQEQVEKYQVPIRDASGSIKVPEEEQERDQKPSAIRYGSRGVQNRRASHPNHPPPIIPYPPPSRSLPQIPANNLTSPYPSNTLATSINLPPPPIPTTEVQHQPPENGTFKTETDVQEFDSRGQLRKRTITRQSSSSSLQSSLPSTHTSPAFEPTVIQALADLKSEQELLNFSLDETKRRMSGTTQGGAPSSRASAASLSSKSFMTDADAELEGWKRRAKLYRDLWAKQKKQTQAAKAQEANIRQTVQQVTREREYYKRQLEVLEAARLSLPRSAEDSSSSCHSAMVQDTIGTTLLADVDCGGCSAEQSPGLMPDLVDWYSSLPGEAPMKGYDALPAESRVWEWFDMSPEKWNHLL